MSALLQPILEDVIAKLVQARIPSPRLEARLLVAEALAIPEQDLSVYDESLSDKQTERLNDMVSRRVSHQPVCKILGRKAFYKNEFIVNGHVLSPRPDTEILVEKAIELAKKFQLYNMIDFGTGSGCILLSVLAEVQAARGVGVDISAEALSIASQNAQKLNLQPRASFMLGSWFDENLAALLKQKFSLLVSNPPYIPSADIAELETEVKNYDPLLALDGGTDGLRDYRRLAQAAPLILTDGAYILLEVGINQARDVAEIFTEQGFILEEILKDYGGIERCVVLHN